MARADTTQTMTLRPPEIGGVINKMYHTSKKRAIFLWGQPGISKSAVSQQQANALGIAFIDVRLSQMDPTDLRGIPFPVEESGVAGIAWSAPLVLPRDLEAEGTREIKATATTIRFYNPTGVNGIYYCTEPKIVVSSITPGLTAELIFDPKAEGAKLDRFRVILRDKDGQPQPGEVAYEITGEAKAILALEEFNSAPPSVQAAAYQLILDKRLGDYVVPKGVYMLAMGNRDTDKGVTFKMPTPIMNRFVHVEMVVNVDDWLEWASSAMIHSNVVGFLGHFTDKLNQFNAGTAARGFPTPRSWEFVSDILTETEQGCTEEELLGLIVGCVGDAAGMEFNEFRKIAADLPDPAEILSGKLTVMPKMTDDKTGGISLAYALTTTLCYRLKEQSDELRRKAQAQGTELRKMKEYDEWNTSADRFLGFIMKNFQPEIAIMGAKQAMAVHKLPLSTQKMTNFQFFADRFKTLILPS